MKDARAGKGFGSRPRQRVRVVCFALLAVIVLGLAGIAYAEWQWHRTVLTVVNQSGGPVDSVEVSLEPGTVHYPLGRLQDGEIKSVPIKPRGESDMTLRFSDGKGWVVWHGGYVKGTGGYRPKLIIGKSNAVCDETRLYSL